MKFIVKDRFGRTVAQTEHESCIPNEDVQKQMKKAGYKIYHTNTRKNSKKETMD